MTTLATKPQVGNAFFKKLMAAPVRDEFCDKANGNFRFTLKDVEKAVPVLAWPMTRGNVRPEVSDDHGMFYLAAYFAEDTRKVMAKVQGAMLISTEELETVYTAEQWEKATFKHDRLIRVHHELSGYDVVIYAGTKRISVGCQTHPLEWWAGEQGRALVRDMYMWAGDKERQVLTDLRALVDGWEKLEKKLAAE